MARTLNWSNLLDLWILARLVLGFSALGLVAVGGAVAARLAWRWRADDSGRRQLAAERKAELVATTLQVAMVFSVGGVVLTALMADRLTQTIRGAMCAYGVLASTGAGFAALGASCLAALGSALWWVLHRFDLSLRRPVLTRRKLIAAIGVAGLVAVDALLTLRFVLQLDFEVIASCCSVFLDGDAAAFHAAKLPLSRSSVGLLGTLAAGVAMISSLAAAARPGAMRGLLAAVGALLGGLLGFAAVTWIVAPHVYATPYHVCPFCLLSATGWWIGWILFPSIGVGTALGLAIGVIELNRRVAGEPEVTDALVGRLGRAAALAWGFGLVVALGVVLGYLVRSGGVSVFGEVG
jgi:hypothetical protein